MAVAEAEEELQLTLRQEAVVVVAVIFQVVPLVLEIFMVDIILLLKVTLEEQEPIVLLVVLAVAEVELLP